MQLFFVSIMIVMVVMTSVVNALEREKLLEVLSPVHGRTVDFQYDDLLENQQEHLCYDYELTREENPVCASNGKKYSNPSTFEFHKCLIAAMDQLDIQIVDMKICRDAELEDLDHHDNANQAIISVNTRHWHHTLETCHEAIPADNRHRRFLLTVIPLVFIDLWL
uniref:Kazal-like domain-containing protein n=1 Tax=Hyaloperonospora arabidopsidis (strain Emoy2) TaxID=559515 RepID=M4B7C7_HYAAE